MFCRVSASGRWHPFECMELTKKGMPSAGTEAAALLCSQQIRHHILSCLIRTGNSQQQRASIIAGGAPNARTPTNLEEAEVPHRHIKRLVHQALQVVHFIYLVTFPASGRSSGAHNRTDAQLADEIENMLAAIKPLQGFPVATATSLARPVCELNKSI